MLREGGRKKVKKIEEGGVRGQRSEKQKEKKKRKREEEKSRSENVSLLS